MNEEMLQWWGLKKGGGDPVTSEWPGVTSVVHPFITIILYLVLVTKFKNCYRKSPYQLRPVLVVYNAFQVSSLPSYESKESMMTSSRLGSSVLVHFQRNRVHCIRSFL